MNTPTTSGGSPRTAAALAARRRATDAALTRVHDALAHMRKHRIPVSTAAVARRAGVSRTFLYDNPTARATVTAATADTRRPKDPAPGAGEIGQQTPWRERALNAEDALKAAHGEISRQRARIGELLGHVRDLEAATANESLSRITTENTTLKQRVRELTADVRIFEERLAAARSTLRFQDRRLADLEAQLAEPAAVGNATAAAPEPGRRRAAVRSAEG